MDVNSKLEKICKEQGVVCATKTQSFCDDVLAWARRQKPSEVRAVRTLLKTKINDLNRQGKEFLARALTGLRRRLKDIQYQLA